VVDSQSTEDSGVVDFDEQLWRVQPERGHLALPEDFVAVGTDRHLVRARVQRRRRNRMYFTPARNLLIEGLGMQSISGQVETPNPCA
jgi:hypothetical protein